VANHDDVCLACHADAAWKADTDIAALHPQRINPEQKRVALALVPTDEAGEKRMGCRTCHDPHGPAEPVHLARVGPDEPTEALCLKCHAEKTLIKHTGHSSAKLQARGLDADSCKPCHAMHARPDGSWGQMLSPRFLIQYCEVGPDQVAKCLPCLACHHPNGPAPVREATTHPNAVMLNINNPTDPGYLPLFNAAGMVDPTGQVVCRTCHVSHGRTDLLAMMERGGLSQEQQDNLRAQVRGFMMPNVCTACHGPEARNLFLLFHDAAGRKRALEAQKQTMTQGR
jgi:predicted CXXCH cytochrome family protein